MDMPAGATVVCESLLIGKDSKGSTPAKRKSVEDFAMIDSGRAPIS
jgi:hypothetical protein